MTIIRRLAWVAVAATYFQIAFGGTVHWKLPPQFTMALLGTALAIFAISPPQ